MTWLDANEKIVSKSGMWRRGRDKKRETGMPAINSLERFPLVPPVDDNNDNDFLQDFCQVQRQVDLLGHGEHVWSRNYRCYHHHSDDCMMLTGFGFRDSRLLHDAANSRLATSC